MSSDCTMDASELQEIILKIVELTNKYGHMSFEGDFGGNTVTISIGEQHVHCGVPDGSQQKLIKDLWNTLVWRGWPL